MRYATFHTHTTYSDGKFSAEEMIQSAIAGDMCAIGFSDHSFTACDTSYCMQKEDYPRYLQELRTLKEKYKDQIPVFAGLELDYYSDDETSVFDYIIASVHYIIENGVCYPIDHSAQQQLSCINDAFGGDIFAMAQRYFDMVCEHVERCNPTFVGHFDVITKFSLMPEEDPRYQQMARDALKRVIRTCPYVEVNTGAIARGYRKSPYPSLDLLKTLHECGGKPMINSDCHHKDFLQIHFDESAQLLKQAGFDCFYIFNGEGFDKVDI